MPTATPHPLPLPPPGGEVASRSGDGVGGKAPQPARSRRKSGTTERARKLRQAGNEAEALLWHELERRRLGGFKFTRQLPIGPYFADFACRSKRLVVEVDGSQHAESKRDGIRDAFMRARGYSVMRFWNHDVLKHRTAVCETIIAALDGRLARDTSAFDLRFTYAPSPAKGVLGALPAAKAPAS